MRGGTEAAALVSALLLGLLAFPLSLIWDTAEWLLRLLQNRKKGPRRPEAFSRRRGPFPYFLNAEKNPFFS